MLYDRLFCANGANPLDGMGRRVVGGPPLHLKLLKTHSKILSLLTQHINLYNYFCCYVNYKYKKINHLLYKQKLLLLLLFAEQQWLLLALLLEHWTDDDPMPLPAAYPTCGVERSDMDVCDKVSDGATVSASLKFSLEEGKHLQINIVFKVPYCGWTTHHVVRGCCVLLLDHC